MHRSPAGTIVSVVCLALLSIARPVAAQDKPNVEVSGGYQLLHLWVGGDDGGSQPLSKGWSGDIAGNVTSSLGVVFQAGGNYKTETQTFSFGDVVATGTAHLKVHQFLGGMRVSARQNKTVTPFGQFLVGAFHISVSAEATATTGGQTITSSSEGESTTKFALQVGGGVNIMFSKKIGVRAGADYLRIFGEDAGLNAVRVAVGAVFAF